MGGLFSKPKAPPPPPPVPPPPPPVREDAQAVAENNAEQMRRRRGRASTVLTGDGTGSSLGDSSPSTAAAKILGN